MRHHWKWQDGWNGIVPGVDTLSTVESKLGKHGAVEDVVGSKCYFFRDNAIRVFVGDEKQVVLRIRVFSTIGDLKLFPATIDDAERWYGPLSIVGRDKVGGITYGGPGVRLLCDLSTRPERVKWIEFFVPENTAR